MHRGHSKAQSTDLRKPQRYERALTLGVHIGSWSIHHLVVSGDFIGTDCTSAFTFFQENTLHLAIEKLGFLLFAVFRKAFENGRNYCTKHNIGVN